jgi:[ribosomal protein S5]-alanine N-acetyltransferase
MREIVTRSKFIPFPILSTERLVLRQLQLTDTEEIFRLRTEREVNRYIPRAPFLDKKEALEFIQKINDGIEQGKWVYWGIRKTEQSKLVGTICLWNFTDSFDACEIGYEMLPEYFGNGYMAEALNAATSFGFKKIKIQSIAAHTYATNVRSVQLLTKAGFKLIIEPEPSMHLNKVVYTIDAS